MIFVSIVSDFVVMAFTEVSIEDMHCTCYGSNKSYQICQVFCRYSCEYITSNNVLGVFEDVSKAELN
jgi:hypothetical protein